MAQIADYPTFTSINRVTEKDGLYQINDDIRILIKYSTADNSEWRFTFRKDDFEELHYYECFIVLICSRNTICLLSHEDINEILDTNIDASQWVSVTYPDKGQMRVNGSLGSLSHTVAHNAFPREILGTVIKKQEEISWPPFSKLNFYWQPPTLIFSSEDRRLDLVDDLDRVLGLFDLLDSVTSEKDVTVYFGLTTISHIWDAWTDVNLEKIENHIKYDLEFDGFNVEIERITDVICPQTKKQDIPCNTEFLWKLKISALNEEEDLEIDVEPEIGCVTKRFPKLVVSNGEPVCSIEIDVDYLSQEEKYQDGGWEDLIKEITAKWVKENSYIGIGTIWAWGSQSVNFHHQSYSMFYAVLGMPKKFRKYLSAEIKILGKHVRPHSDDVIPNAEDGWDARCHIEDGRAWGILDAASWKEIKS